MRRRGLLAARDAGRRRVKAEIEPAGGLVHMTPDTTVNRLVTAAIKEPPDKPDKRRTLLGITVPEGIVLLSLLFLVHLATYYYNYLLFHMIVELFGIFIAITIANITINRLPYIENQYLRFIGISYLFVGLLELMHTLSYKGMPIFTDYDYYSTQFWIAARYMEAASMLAGFGLLKMKSRVNPVLVAAFYAVITAWLIASILYYKTFPVCFVAGKGLTPFKIVSEYVICTLFAASIVLLYLRRAFFESRVYRQLMAALALMILAELSFTLYATVSDAFNEIGHLLKICAFYLIYKAIAVTAVDEPVQLLFRELSSSERRLREAQDLARVGRWDMDFDTKEWTWTAEMYSFFSAGEATAPSLNALLKPLQPRDREKVRDVFSRLACWGTPFELLLRAETGGGEVRFGQLRGEVLRGEDGGISHLHGTLQDVTGQQIMIEDLKDRTAQLHQRTKELADARDAAEAASKAKSVFLANMSHELRTPLIPILGFSTLMRREPCVSASQREDLGVIYRSGERLLTLINEVLDLAQAETGRLQLEIAPFDLAHVVRNAVDTMSVEAREKGLELHMKQSPSFPRFVKGNGTRLRQILLHLIGNAVKFTSEGSVTVRLRTRPGERNHLIIDVEDTGPGIEPEDRARLFQPFVQLAEPGMQKGIGLGLAITRRLTELMGGSVSLTSAPGEGSTFRVELPVELAEEETVSAPPVEAGPGEVCGLVPGQPDYRILIAEDQKENRALLTKIVKCLGLSVRAVKNGRQCVDMFQRWHPHLVWMNRRLPVMDGAETARRIRELPGGDKVRIVVVTACASKGEGRQLLDAGMDDFVCEPYRVDEIYGYLARHLGLEYLYRPAAPEMEAGASYSIEADEADDEPWPAI